MNDLALALYIGGFAGDVIGSGLAAYDLKQRLGKLRKYTRPVVVTRTFLWNVEAAGDIKDMLAGRNAQMVKAQLEAAVHRLTRALDEERAAREAAETRLLSLHGIGDRAWRLWLGAGLLFAGVVLGGLGNLASTAGWRWPL